MVIPFPPGVPFAHLIPEGPVGPISLVLRKAHPLGVVCVSGQERGSQRSQLSCTDPAFGSQVVRDMS